VRALLRPLFAWSGWDHPANVMASTKDDGASLSLFDWSAWAQPATVVAGTIGEGDVLACVQSFGVGSTSHCGSGHDVGGRCSGLCSLGRRGFNQPLC
jgi:hypothetical protein